VVSRILYDYDRNDTSRIFLHGLRRYKPSVIHTWQPLAEHEDIKNVKDEGQGHALGVEPGWRSNPSK
jgi:hypothetical protein